ncbi:MAG: glycosyltransferase family 2 protein [Rhodobacteraceae bacterium]|nr:glycosyltransferase family 2 protein [Paracoccaceae bacterium]
MEIDLSHQACVNIDFLDPVAGDVPFHLSLRRDEGVIVLNRCAATGWRREVPLAAPLRRTLHDLHLECRRDLLGNLALRVWLDGRVVARADAYPRPARGGRFFLRRGFVGLRRVSAMTWPTGLRSLRRIAPMTRGLSPRMELILPYLATTEAQVVLPDGTHLPLLPVPGDGMPGLQHLSLVSLPGRIWHGADVLLKLQRLGSTETLNLRRADLCAALQRPEAGWIAQNDIAARMQMLEHVHFAKVWDALPPKLRGILQRAAATAPQAGFGPPDKLKPADPPAPSQTDPVLGARDAFHRCAGQKRTDAPSEMFRAICAEHDLAPDQIVPLALQLSEWFCLHSDPRLLWPLAARMDAGNDVGLAALPMLWGQGDWPLIRQTLRRYPRKGGGWVLTPCLAWTACALARNMPDHQGAPPPAEQRIAMMTALLDLVAELAPNNASHMPCTRLIGAVLAILAQLPYLPDWCASWYPARVLAAYGLRPEFWQQARADSTVMALPQIAEAARHFEMLERALATGRPLMQAASPFLEKRIAGAEPLARVLGQQIADRPDITGPPITAEACLRWLARPRTGAERAALMLEKDEPVHRAACHAMRFGARHIPRPTWSRATAHLAAQIALCEQALKQGQIPLEPAVTELRRAGSALCIPEVGYAGLAGLLSIAETAARQGDSELARDLRDTALQSLPAGQDLPKEALAARLSLARFVALCPEHAVHVQDRISVDPDMLPRDTQDARARALRATASPFADTLVALVSCHANLASRVPQVMAAWGTVLRARGIPVITVVGRPAGQYRAPTRFDGSVLQLDAPDDYEGLPQKILALAEWVLARTGFGRMLKIDDDCYLDPNAYFADGAFLNTPYYGRPLRRVAGSMDRAWHMAKAGSVRGRQELDKSPEPSLYADGSTGYMLARPALQSLVTTRNTARGRALEQVSFMEDKLVGDLLGLAGVTVKGPGYDVAVFRKAAAGLPPLSQYENSFLPFAGSGLKLVHLDGETPPAKAQDAACSPWPSPMKIWPANVPARTGWANNALDLVTPPERLEAARTAPLAVIAVMRNEAVMLPHFLAHYRRLGAGAFLVVDNGSDDGTLEALLAQPDVSVFSTDTPYRLSSYGVDWQEALMAQFRLGKWSLLADADELAFWRLPDADGHVRGDLPKLLEGADFAQCDAVRLLMLDLYPDQPLSQVPLTRAPFAEAGWLDRKPLLRDWQGRGPWSNCETVTSALRHRLMAQGGAPARANLFVAQKYALLKYHPLMRLSAGLHYLTGARVAARDLALGHFKYHAAFHAKAEAEVARGQHFNNAEEYRQYLGLRAEARDVMYDPALSVRLADCKTVQEICAAFGSGHPALRGKRAAVTGAGLAMTNTKACAKPVLDLQTAVALPRTGGTRRAAHRMPRATGSG